MILNKDHEEVSMRYEGLAMAILECKRGDDPWGISDANFFRYIDDGNNNLIPSKDCIYGINTIIDIAIWKHKGDKELIQILKKYKIETYKINTQDKVKEIIDDLMLLFEKNGY